MCICDLHRETRHTQNCIQIERLRLESMALNIFGLPASHFFVRSLRSHENRTMELFVRNECKNSATPLNASGKFVGALEITRIERRSNYPKKRFNETTIKSAKKSKSFGSKTICNERDALGFLFHTNTELRKIYIFQQPEQLKTVTTTMSSRDRFARGANAALTCNATRDRECNSKKTHHETMLDHCHAIKHCSDKSE